MHKAAKHTCPYHGCGALVEYGHKYCPAHQIVADINKRDMARAYEAKGSGE